jgi:hypothetical protein
MKRIVLAVGIAVVVCSDIYGMNEIGQDYQMESPDQILPLMQTDSSKQRKIKQRFTPEEDNMLISLVNQLGTDDWIAIAEQLGNGRNVRQVKERYHLYLKDSINKDPWTPEEDQLLLRLYIPTMKWKDMVPYFSGRTDVQIKNRYNFLRRHEKTEKPIVYKLLSQPEEPSQSYEKFNMLDIPQKHRTRTRFTKERAHFTKEEDALIKQLVEKFGHDWDSIAEEVQKTHPNRKPKHIRDRYRLHLNQNINKNPWTEEEDQQILQKVNEHGQKWATIAKDFFGRTEVNIKNRYNFLRRHGKTEEPIVYKLLSQPEEPSQSYEKLSMFQSTEEEQDFSGWDINFDDFWL